MNPYLVSIRNRTKSDPGYLVFAHDSVEACYTALHSVPEFANLTIDEIVAALLAMTTHSYLLQYGDVNRIINDEAHFVSDIPFCGVCRKWENGPNDVDGRCPGCASAQKAAAEAGFA